MELTRQAPADRQIIQRYRNGGFRVSGVVFAGSVIVTPGATALWPVTAMDQLTASNFKTLIDSAPGLDVCLLGCGARMQPLPKDLRLALKEAGLAIDPMDTGAACRTFNVLMNEGRAVAAALIAI